MIEPLTLRLRGRPKGSKNKPKTLGAFIAQSLVNPYTPPPKAPKKRGGDVGIWAKLKTPEERSAYAKRIRSKVTPEGLSRSGRKAGSPNGWTAPDFAEAEKRAEKDSKAFLKRMEESGQLPNDPIAREATFEVLKLLRSPCSKSLRLACVRTLLSYFHATPGPVAASKALAAEALLDELDREGPSVDGDPASVQPNTDWIGVPRDNQDKNLRQSG